MKNDKEKLNVKKTELMNLTKAFSREYLNEEYDVVIEKLNSKMARKRTVPFLTGKIEIWAAATIHAVGTVNFLFDQDTEPYASVHDICNFFETKQSTITQKSKLIRDLFKMTYFDGEFATASVNKDNPLHDFDLLDGFIVPRNK
jgi:hypothetical protein